MAFLNIFFIVGLCISLAFAIFLVKFVFAAPKTPYPVLAICILSYFIVIIPPVLMLADSINEAGDKHTMAGDLVLEDIWTSAYWISFAMTWFILPFMNCYYSSGQFEFKKRLSDSLRRNVVEYIIYASLTVIFLFVALFAGTVHFADIDVFFVVCANTFGMLMIVILLGYGLVEVPRVLFYRGNRVVHLKSLHYSLAGYATEVEEGLEAFYQYHHFMERLTVKLEHERYFHGYMVKIQEHMPSVDDFDLSKVAVRHLEPIDILEELRKKTVYVEDDFVRLHKAVIDMKHKLLLADSQWKETVEETIAVEDLISVDRNSTNISRWNSLRAQHENKFWTVLCVLCSILSILMLWAETVAWTENDISLIGDLLAINDEFVVSLLGFIVFCYFLTCGYYGLFKIKLFDMYCLHSNNRTDANSLLLSASFLLRVYAPLTYNFSIIYHIQASAFIRVIGVVEVFAVGGKSFNSLLPILIIIFALCTIFNVFNKFLSCMGISHFQRTEGFEDDAIAEGKLLLRRERNKKTKENSILRDQSRDDVALLDF